MMTLVHFDEAMIHMLQFPLVVSRCNITFSMFWISQGSVATLIKWDGWSLYCHMCRSFLNLIVKKSVKICWFLTKLQTKISWLLFMGHGVRCFANKHINHIQITPGHSWTTFHSQSDRLYASDKTYLERKHSILLFVTHIIFLSAIGPIANWCSLCVQHSPTAAVLSTSFLCNHAPNSPELNALITRFMESYSNVSMSCESKYWRNQAASGWILPMP